MPELNGVQLAKLLANKVSIVFTTAYPDYAVEGFELKALDYLVKPIETSRLKAAVEKAIESIELKRAAETSGANQRLGPKDQVFVKDGDNCWFVKLDEIRLFESVGNYVRLHFGDNRPLIHKSLNGLSERLDDTVFFRANRQQIINLNWVEEIQQWFSGGLLITLKGSEKIELSRRQAAKFRDMKSL